MIINRVLLTGCLLGVLSGCARYYIQTGQLDTQIDSWEQTHHYQKALDARADDRRALVALEGLYEFETGLTPRITFGPNRRIGARGAYIVSLDAETKRLAPVSGWIEPR